MIVFPMAGLSSRFTAAGYKRPKYMLEAHGRTLFSHAIAGFSAYFDTTPFLFIARDVSGSEAFIRSQATALGVREFEIVILDQETAGQADTVARGLKTAGISSDGRLTIFNIDTFRSGFRYPDFEGSPIDGFLEVFRGAGANWSYVRPTDEGNDRVAETAEKRSISNLCCTGLYDFASRQTYLEAFETYRNDDAVRSDVNELYIAPMYNLLIRNGADIRYSVIDRSQVIFCGVPAEYDEFRSSSAAAPSI
jgi:NDP-sugar pyrophosphorylase family protein